MWIKGLVGQGFGGSGGSERVMGECLVGQWIVGVISFQKIFGLYGLERHIVEKRWGVTLVDGRRKCEDRARILKQNSQLSVYYLQTEPKQIEKNEQLNPLAWHFVWFKQ